MLTRSVQILVVPLLCAGCAVEDFVQPTSQTLEIDPSMVAGQGIANTNCANCHGAALTGMRIEGLVAPSLTTVHDYTPSSFSALMAAGGTDHGGQVAAAMTSCTRDVVADEVTSLYAYLNLYARWLATLPGSIDPEFEPYHFP